MFKLGKLISVDGMFYLLTCCKREKEIRKEAFVGQIISIRFLEYNMVKTAFKSVRIRNREKLVENDLYLAMRRLAGMKGYGDIRVTSESRAFLRGAEFRLAEIFLNRCVGGRVGIYYSVTVISPCIAF